jgi:hypothetical protein
LQLAKPIRRLDDIRRSRSNYKEIGSPNYGEALGALSAVTTAAPWSLAALPARADAQ